MKTTTPPVRNSMSHSARDCRPVATLLILLMLACFALAPAPNAFGVLPAPDGGYLGNNTAEGTNALLSLTTGANNTAVGANALLKTTNGSYNAGFGSRALENNIHGNFNMAVGTQALFNNTGSANLAVGFRTLFFNTTGHNLTGIGAGALYKNTTGIFNTAIGYQALFSNIGNIGGAANTAIGDKALFNNISGSGITAIGFGALFLNTNSDNTAIGFDALLNNTTGFNNIALGAQAGQNITIENNNIDIGNFGVSGDSDTIRVGSTQTSTFIAGIFGQASAGGATVFVNSSGKLGTSVSSARFKQNVQDMGDSSHALLALRPVTFHYKPELDPDGIAQFGLVAEEVEKINPALVVRDADGKPYTVRYEAVNAMLLNEFLKEHRKVQELKATVAQHEKDFQSKLVGQQKQIEALTSGLEKVTAQLEVKKPAPRIASNDQ